MTSWWFALGADPRRQLHDYASHYLGVFGERAGRARWPRRAPRPGRRPSARRCQAAVDAGYDEIQLVPTATDLGQLDELTELLSDLL